MIRMNAREFWPKYRDEVRKRCSAESMKGNWHRLGIEAAKTVIEKIGIETWKEELRLDLIGYERRTAGAWYDSDIRVAFEHEVDHPYPYHDDGKGWRCELWKLSHIVADLRVLVGYYETWNGFENQFRSELDRMGDRLHRTPHCEWLFIFGAIDSKREPQPWRAWTFDANHSLIQLDDNKPFCPAEHCGLTKR